MFSLIFITCFFFGTLAAPPSSSMVIFVPEEINYYKPLIYAIGMVEGRCDTLAYNPEEEAVGYFQIRPVRLNDYNIRTGNNYTLMQMYDYDIAKEIFMYYTQGRSYEKVAKTWNGSGPMTITYWKKVKAYL